ncbi:MgtC/SapB family protein [Gordonia jinhuaensis]|uniref:Mg2+ transport P-type ATPase C MgtC n=1 Tax=Gordonia jinhuaensis TaxID=1517702 RepID=A0A916WS33_9ACTN|nr:MgtC/SapB family protein [Gordonia jinhuaensis]GGB29353.1 putative Mg2+ transport P-type ATPase C MgtC [Gordonia jinhuaensis]
MSHTTEFMIRILVALACGAAIGFERQWRARTAGLRTNALVSLGAALFVVMGAFSFHGPDADPTRVAAQVVSGIGFLGAGVIMKQGATISGLNTAATLWASAAVGSLAGGGMIGVALVGTATVMAANTMLRPLARLLDRHHSVAGREQPEVDYQFLVTCKPADEVSVRALVFDAIHQPQFTVRSIAAIDEPDGTVTISAQVHSEERTDSAIETALAAVVRADHVTSVRWSATEQAVTD